MKLVPRCSRNDLAFLLASPMASHADNGRFWAKEWGMSTIFHELKPHGEAQRIWRAKGSAPHGPSRSSAPAKLIGDS